MAIVKRLGSFIVDAVIIVILENLFVISTQFDPGNVTFYSSSTYSELLGTYVDFGIGHSILVIIFYFFYNLVMELSPSKGTIGKIVFKLEVVDLGNDELNFFQLIVRNILKMIFTFSYVNFIIIWFTPNNFTLHDFFSKTRVSNRFYNLT